MNLQGKRFDKLVVVKCVGTNKHRHKIWECLCDCGNKPKITRPNLISGKTKSCGCLRADSNKSRYIHGRDQKDPTYMSWAAMKIRCRKRKRYIDKGITVCKEWESDFLQFLQDVGERPENKTLDRMNNSKGYYKENCRWATPKEQRANQD